MHVHKGVAVEFTLLESGDERGRFEFCFACAKQKQIVTLLREREKKNKQKTKKCLVLMAKK